MIFISESFIPNITTFWEDWSPAFFAGAALTTTVVVFLLVSFLGTLSTSDLANLYNNFQVIILNGQFLLFFLWRIQSVEFIKPERIMTGWTTSFCANNVLITIYTSLEFIRKVIIGSSTWKLQVHGKKSRSVAVRPDLQ